LDEVDLKATNNVQVKLEVDKAELPSGKDQKVEAHTCFQVISADKQYIFSASSETEAEDWFASIRVSHPFSSSITTTTNSHVSPPSLSLISPSLFSRSSH